LNAFLRVIVFICGLILILPGLCTLVFGGIFAVRGIGIFAAVWLVVGGALVWVGWLVLSAAVGQSPSPPLPGPRPPPPPDGPR
jgi:hypothetical protein